VEREPDLSTVKDLSPRGDPYVLENAQWAEYYQWQDRIKLEMARTRYSDPNAVIAAAATCC
jgi:hypothetical protein